MTLGITNRGGPEPQDTRTRLNTHPPGPPPPPPAPNCNLTPTNEPCYRMTNYKLRNLVDQRQAPKYGTQGMCEEEEEEEEEEEMRSPVGRTCHTTPCCPPAYTDLAKHHGSGSPLRLLPIIPWRTQRARTPTPRTAGTPEGMERGVRRSTSPTSSPVCHPPLGEGDTVSRMWALRQPGTTDWAAFGRQVTGAWSVA